MWGKVVGFALGFIFGRIGGALLGLYVGHLFDRRIRENFSAQGGFGRFASIGSEADRQAIFFYATFSVMGHIAKSNGRITPAHIQTANLLMTHMGMNERQIKEAQQAFREGKAEDFNLSGTLKDFRRSVFGRRNILQMFVEIQIQGAFSDGVIEPQERELLETVGKKLGFAQAEITALISRWETEYRFHQQQQETNGANGKRAPATKNELANAYQLLEVSPDSSAADIKKAYKKLMNQHHPDKLMSKGLPPQMMELAKAKAQDIQAAYDMIRNHP